MINIKDFDSSLLKIDKKSYKSIDIYYIGYITIKDIDDCENIYSVNPLYLTVNHASGHIEEKNKNKCRVFDSTDENKDLLKKYTVLRFFWMNFCVRYTYYNMIGLIFQKELTLTK